MAGSPRSSPRFDSFIDMVTICRRRSASAWGGRCRRTWRLDRRRLRCSPPSGRALGGRVGGCIPDPCLHRASKSHALSRRHRSLPSRRRHHPGRNHRSSTPLHEPLGFSKRPQPYLQGSPAHTMALRRFHRTNGLPAMIPRTATRLEAAADHSQGRNRREAHRAGRSHTRSAALPPPWTQEPVGAAPTASCRSWCREEPACQAIPLLPPEIRPVQPRPRTRGLSCSRGP